MEKYTLPGKPLFAVRREVALNVTPKAVEKIRELAIKNGKPNAALRVRIVAGGCAGLQYKMDFADAPAKDDSVIEVNEVKIYIDPKSGLFLHGSKFDYTEGLGLMRSGFEVSNPNSKGKCSCGESFSA